MKTNTYELEWTNEFGGSCRVCLECNGILELAYESEDGSKQEWQCEHCWHKFDQDDRRTGKVHYAGMGAITCPECGDHRIARDSYDDSYYCHQCKTTYREVVIETQRVPDGLTRDGTLVGKIVDFGPAESPETCPNCGDLLRRQRYDLPNGENCWGYYCEYCDIAYHEDGGKLVRPRQCAKCGGYAITTLTLTKHDHKFNPPQPYEDKILYCRLCKTEFDLDGDYLHDADRPKDGERQDDLGDITDAPTTQKA